MSIHNSEFFDNFGQVLNKYPNIDLNDLFSKGQMESKRWLVNELEKINMPLGNVFICAGWYGSLATFLFESNLKIEKIRSFDIDSSCASIAETFNRTKTMDGWKFKASTVNILDMEYPTIHTTYRADGSSVDLTDMPDTIINTSCEHIENFTDWYAKIPDGRLVVLQSNNFFEVEEHVNCVKDIKEFGRMAPMTGTLYAGELELPKYTRFMLIGYK